MELIFDIGYHLGTFADCCIKEFPDCQVIGVEGNPKLAAIPAPKNVTLLNRIASDVDDVPKKIHIAYEEGISTVSEKFMKTSRFIKGSINIPTPGNSSQVWGKSQMVPTITLDTLIKMYGAPDMIKIDVEGHEYEVLKGLTQKQKLICFEWHEELFDEFIKCADHLIELGYQKFGMVAYLVQGNISEIIDWTDSADAKSMGFTQPKHYEGWPAFSAEVARYILPERRVNFGMCFVK